MTSDDQQVDLGTFSFQGGAPTLETVSYDLPAGTHTIKAYTWWTASDGNTRSIDAPPVATAVVTCGVPTPPPPPPAVVTPPPPDVQPPADVTPPAPFVAVASVPVTGSAVKAKVVTKHHKMVHKAKKKPRVAAAKVAKVVRKAPRLTG